MTPREAKQKLIDAGRVLEAEGHDDMTRGHISVRVPGDPSRFYMKPHSFGLDEMTMENIVTCDLEGEKVEGTAPRHSEVYIHSEIFRVRADVTSIIHSHPPHSVAVSASGRPLRVLSQPSAAFIEGVPVYTGTIDLIRNKDQGRGVAESLGRHKAALMKNHGVVIAGSSIEEAVVLAIMLENACHVQLLAEAAGGTAPEFPRAQILDLKEKLMNPVQMTVNFDYLRRKVQRGG
jgi:ribulose-5-phosphate 4-epimerase/fuculose-1-phosphate aldolase